MQSFLQYRRFRRHLEQQIKEHGLAATANVQDEFPFHALWECAENVARRQAAEKSGLDPEADGVLSLHLSSTTTANNDLHTVLTGVQSQNIAADPSSVEDGPEKVFVVNFQGPSDPLNPQTWSRTRKWVYTFLLGTTGFVVSGASAFDTGVTPQAARYFGVKEEVQLLSTSLYMIALGLGSLVSAPFSETVGRNPVYIICENLRETSTL